MTQSPQVLFRNKCIFFKPKLGFLWMPDVMHRGYQNLSDSGAQLIQATRWGARALSLPAGWMCGPLLWKQGWCRHLLIFMQRNSAALQHSWHCTFPFFSFQFGEILFFIRARSVSLGYLRGAVKPERHRQKNVIERFSKLVGFEGFVLELICLKSLTDLALECSDDWFVLCFKELW